jgi:hypothetical protein
MLFDELWETVVRGGWRMAIAEHRALAVGAVIVVAVLIWDRVRSGKRTRRMEIELRKMEKKVYILERQESGRLTRLVRELSAKSRVKVDAHDKVDARDAGVELSVGDGTAPTTSPPAPADQREGRNSTKLSCNRRSVLYRKTIGRKVSRVT